MLEDLKISLSEIIAGSGIFNLAQGPIHDAITVSQEIIKRDKFNIAAAPTQFQWSPDACTIRDEIAILAECEASTIGGHSSIFSLGLDSIDVVKLSSRLKRHSFNIPVSTIMRNPSIESLVKVTSKTPETTDQNRTKTNLNIYRERLSNYLQTNRVVIEDLEDLLPPTPLQEAIVADMLSTKSLRYFNQEILLLDPSTNVDRLMIAWKAVIEQSPLLRTSFISIDDPEIPFSIAQVVHQPGTARLRNVEVGIQETHTVIQEAKNFDRAAALNGVLLMLTFIHDKDNTHLILSISHALYDGWSIALLHNDVMKAYHNNLLPRPLYRNTLEHIINASGAEASDYWKNYISGVKHCSFPSRIPNDPFSSRIHRLEKSSSVQASSIKSFIKREAVTLQALGQTCWALVLASYLKSLEVVYGVVLSGRDTEESSQVLFPTMNTIAVRSIIHGSAKEMLQDMQDSCVYATQFQHFPLRKVQAAGRGNGKKLFDSLFILQKKPSLHPNTAKLYESVGGDSSVEVSIRRHRGTIINVISSRSVSRWNLVQIVLIGELHAMI